MKHIIIAGILLGMTAGAYAESQYDALVAEALKYNYELKAGEQKADAELAAARAENTLEGPEAEFEHLWGHGTEDTRWSVSVSQEFALPGVYNARSKAASLEHLANRAVLDCITLDKALSVKLLIIDAINARQRLEYYTTVGSYLSRVDSLTRKSFDLGNATILDVRKMQLAIIDNNREINAARQDFANILASLSSAGCQSAASFDDWDKYPLQELRQTDTTPLLQAIQARSDAAAARSKAMRREALPTFSLGYVHAFEENTHFNGLSVSMRLPSFSQSKRRKALELETQAELSSLQGENLAASTESSVLYDTAKELGQEKAQYSALSSDNSYLDLLQRAYDGGELSIIDYLNEIMLFSKARLGYLDLDYRFNLTLARLNRYNSPGF